MSLSTRGGRHLAILGAGAILIAGVTTGISLMVYRNSGDIYLDRSRIARQGFQNPSSRAG